MDENINDLIKKFNNINKMGYVKSINNNINGGGLTFEHLLGKNEDNFSFADYKGIELKTKIVNSSSDIHLFSLSPEGLDFFESRRLWQKYGHPGIKNKNSKNLNNTIIAGKLVNVGINNYFSLNVNYKFSKIILEIYNKEKVLLENYSYWNFSRIESVLKWKINYLALIKVYVKNLHGIRYYKYSEIRVYKLKSFDNFIKLIEFGKITISFHISKTNINDLNTKVHDRGTVFSISEDDLDYLYDRIY